MLYIEKIDDNSIRFGNAVGGGTYPKVWPITLQAMTDETGRVWIFETNNEQTVLNNYDVDNINLEGSTYATGALFAAAFNNLVGATISGGGGSGSSTSTAYNTPDAGTVTNDTLTISANTIHAITITCISDSADITVGGSSFTIDEGQSVSWEATGLLDADITIDTTGGATYSVDYITIGAAPTTTTTTT